MHVELKDRHNCVMHGTGCWTGIYWQCTARYKDLLTVYCSVQKSINSVLLCTVYWMYSPCTAQYIVLDVLTVSCSVQCIGCTLCVPLSTVYWMYSPCTAQYSVLDVLTVYRSVQCTGCTHRVPLGVEVVVEHGLAQVDLACGRVDEEVLLAQRTEAVVTDEVLRHVVGALQHQHGIGSQGRYETHIDLTPTRHRVTVTL